ncbi:DNA-directed RNA polymerase II subunit, partial [Cladochytrium tenue]
MSHVMQLHPQYFGPRMREWLTRRLYEEVEGTCSGRYGYVISVVEIVDIGRGVLQTVTGFAEFRVVYKAIVFKPFKNQVVDGLVTTVNRLGFFADVGPLQVFVSAHLIPPYLKFEPNTNPPAYIGEGQELQDTRIEKNETVRIRLVGTRLDATEI